MLHVAQISFFVDPQRRDPERMLDDWHSLPDAARATAEAGLRVSVVQASSVEGSLVRDGVAYSFIAPDRPGALLTRSARFATLLHSLAPDVLHVHGMCFPREVLGLRELAPTTPLLLQDHAEAIPRLWRRRLWKSGAAVADGMIFCTRDQAEQFMRLKLIGPHTPIFEIPESASGFTPGDQSAAREITGMHGDPAVLWVGRLDRNKDPLAVLDGIAAAVPKLPNLAFWMCFGGGPLLEAVEVRIRNDERLRDRVKLLGCVPRERVQQLMRAADLFVLGSHREGCSYSLMEALASALPAAVSNIPSSRALLGEGAEAGGRLWPCGDSAALARVLCELAAAPRERLRASARARFDSHLSPHAVGARLAAAYQTCVVRKVA
jgi:glycosyltransferase involved in cell wall biosynthesis